MTERSERHPWGMPRPPCPMPTFDDVTVKSAHLLPRRVGDVSEFDFDASQDWQDYLWEQFGPRPPSFFTLKIRDDAGDYAFTGGRRKNGALVGTTTIPSAWLTGSSAEENAPVFRQVKERFFADLARAAGLPDPPPLPEPVPRTPRKRAPGAGTAWLTERRGFHPPDLHTEEWYFDDPAWQDYLEHTYGDQFSIVYCVVDSPTLKRSYARRRNGEVTVRVNIPVEDVVVSDDPELLFVQIERDTCVWAMEKFGWPEPPPLPAPPKGRNEPEPPRRV